MNVFDDHGRSNEGERKNNRIAQHMHLYTSPISQAVEESG